jgi:hypothetical protein
MASAEAAADIKENPIAVEKAEAATVETVESSARIANVKVEATVIANALTAANLNHMVIGPKKNRSERASSERINIK